MIKSVCVFCSSSNKIDKKYFDLAYNFGKLLAKEKVTLVYGGSSVGMMGAVADGCMAADGRSHGVTTDHLHSYELAHEGLNTLEVAPDMHTRKKRMFDLSDGIVVLPGGFGTLDETLEVLTWKQIGLHAKPIVILNFEEYWSSLKSLLGHIIDHRFAMATDGDLFRFVDNMEDVIPLMRSLPQVTVDPTKKYKD